MSKPSENPTADPLHNSLTLGKRLATQRQARQLTVEDVARVLRLRANLIREIEQDDFRSFDHPSYARLTILSYSRFLGLPDAEVLPWLPEPGGIFSGNYQYMEHLSAPETSESDEIPIGAAPSKKSWAQTALLITGLLILAVLGGYGYLLWNNLNRLAPKSTSQNQTIHSTNNQPANPQANRNLELELKSFQNEAKFLDDDALDLRLQGSEPAATPLEEPQDAVPPASPTLTTSPSPTPATQQNRSTSPSPTPASTSERR